MKEFTEQMIADRRFLHAHPEEGWCEFETTWYIVNRLQELGLEWKAGIDVIEPTAVMGRNAELVEKAQNALWNTVFPPTSSNPSAAIPAQWPF